MAELEAVQRRHDAVARRDVPEALATTSADVTPAAALAAPAVSEDDRAGH